MDFNKFSLSKVYKLTSPNTEKIYIGSTTERYLSSRLSKHKAHYKLGGRYTANKILECDNVKIELLELCPCDNAKQLREKERKYIEENKPICINKNIPGRTWKERNQTEEYKNYMKEYYIKKKSNNI